MTVNDVYFQCTPIPLSSYLVENSPNDPKQYITFMYLLPICLLQSTIFLCTPIQGNWGGLQVWTHTGQSKCFLGYV